MKVMCTCISLTGTLRTEPFARTIAKCKHLSILEMGVSSLEILAILCFFSGILTLTGKQHYIGCLDYSNYIFHTSSDTTRTEMIHDSPVVLV